jgi:N-acetylglucosaminyl-diphospho-decaprenol L-rhamnosyltransferase
MDLSIIIVNWNSVAYARECISSVYENTHDMSFEIIVVDNASPDGDVDALKATFSRVKIIKSLLNVGFARANNLGFEHSCGTYVLLLNPDTKLVGPAITTLWKWLKAHPEAGIVGCKHVSPDFTVQTTTIQTFPTIVNQMFNIERLRLLWPKCPLWRIGALFSEDRKPTAVDVIPGACMLMTRELFASVGMFSDDYFMYGEDIDLNFKVHRAGFKNYYIPDAVIIHYGGRSSSQQRVNHWATTMKFKAMTQYYTKNHSPMYAAMYRVAMMGCAVARLLLIALAYPLGRFFVDAQALSSAAGRWSTVLKAAAWPSPRPTTPR